MRTGPRRAENASRRFLRHRHGFTLIEMVGVLAIVMILATVIFSATLKQMDLVAASQESATIKRYADALQQSVLRNRYIPTDTNWASVVAAELGESVAAISANPRGRQRMLLVHPLIQIGVNGGDLPYSQSVTGSVVTQGSQIVPPINPQLMIVSSLGPALPSFGSGITSNQWAALWNAPDNTVPSAASPWNTWGGSGDDLRVQRINLSPLFVHVLLNNSGTPGPGICSFDWLKTNAVPTGAVGVDAYFLKNTILGLFKHTGALESQQILAGDSTFVYSQGSWRSSLTTPSGTPSAVVMNLVAGQFLDSLWNINAAGPPDTQATVLDRMEAFMNAYTVWAALGSFPHTNNAAFTAVVAAQNALDQATLNLMNNPVEGGGS